MKKSKGIVIRCVVLTVLIPKNYLFDFMQVFGDEFKEFSTTEGRTNFKAVRDYKRVVDDIFHVEIEIYESQERHFRGFLREFYSSRNIPFRI